MSNVRSRLLPALALATLTGACVYGSPTSTDNGARSPGASNPGAASAAGSSNGSSNGTSSPGTGASSGSTSPGEVSGSSVPVSPPVPGAAGSASSTGAPLVDGVSPGLVRRLSSQEIGNSLTALLGVTPASLSQIPADKTDYEFDRVAQAQTVTAAHVVAFGTVADEVATLLTPTKLAAIAPSCAGNVTSDGAALLASRRACIADFIDAVAPRALRHPLEDDRRSTILSLYDGSGTWADGLRVVVNTLFTAPDFLYVIETGTATDKPGVFALSDLEIATRLSLFACEVVPDAPLMAAATAGQLHEPAQITAQAQRLFALPCARTAVTRFYRQWLNVDKVNGLVRDPSIYPQFNSDLAAAMAREQDAFVDDVTFDHAGTLQELFTANYSFVDQTLAPLYGMSVSGSGMSKVQLPAERHGLLTQPSLMAITAHANETSPILRGVYVLKRLLCRNIPPPPANLNITTPAAAPVGTGSHARWVAHSNNPTCSGCHQQIDPVGFAMEDFDAIGRHRTTDNGQPIDTSGAIASLNIPNGQVNGAGELSEALAKSPELAGCFARQWFRYGMARLDGVEDAKAVSDMATTVAQGRPLREMMTSLVASYPFNHRAVAANP